VFRSLDADTTYEILSPRDFGAGADGAASAPRTTSILAWCQRKKSKLPGVNQIYLHWLAVDFDTVELLSGVGCAGRLTKDDGGDTSTASSLGISKENFPY